MLWLQLIVAQRSNARTAQLDHRMSDQIKHAAYLLVLSFVKQDFKPGVVFRLTYFPDLRRRGARTVVERHAASQAFYSLLVWNPLHFSFINFFDFVASRGDEVCEVAIVG